MKLSHIEEDYLARLEYDLTEDDQLEVTLDDYKILKKHWLPVLLYCPDDVQLRYKVFEFLEEFRIALIDSEYENRELLKVWKFSSNGFSFCAEYKTTRTDPYDKLEPCDYDLSGTHFHVDDAVVSIKYYGLCNWLERECNVLFAEHEIYQLPNPY